MATKWVYMFTEGNATMRNLLGGKGANLAEMTNLGLPVPQAFAATSFKFTVRGFVEEIKATVTHLNRALEKVRCGRRLDQEIIRKGSLALTDEDFAKLQQCGYVQENYQKMDFTEENSFDTVYVMERQMPVEKILAGMKKIFADPSCGAVFRIKGFMQEENGSWIEVNATRHELKKQPIKEGQEILIVIGEGLQEAAIRKYLS